MTIDRSPTDTTSDGMKPGWRTVRFGDVVRNADDNERNPREAGIERYVGLDHLDPESLHIKRWGLVEEGTTFTRKFKPGQVLFGKRRAYQRKAAVAEFEGICSGDILVFEPLNGELIPELLPFIVQSDGFFNHALGTSAGSLSPRTKWKDLANYEFALPPRDEQRRIAEILWAADEAINMFMVAESRIDQHKERYLTSIFDPANNQDTKQVIQLGSALIYASDGPFGSKLKTEHYSKQGARVVRLQNIGSSVFLDDDKAYISDNYYRDLGRYGLRSGDVIVAGLGDETHQVGRACIVPEHLGLAINKADCFCLRAKKSLLDNEYLMYFLNSSFGKRQILQRAQGTTRLRVNVSNLKTVSMPLPSIERQKEISKTLQLIDEAAKKLRDQLWMNHDLSKIIREHFFGSIEISQ